MTIKYAPTKMYWKTGVGYVPCPRTAAGKRRLSKAHRDACKKDPGYGGYGRKNRRTRRSRRHSKRRG